MIGLYTKFKLSAEYQTFTNCQKKFFEHFFKGENVCLTGEAGTGKSYVLNKLSLFLEKNNVSVGVTATTGVAAFNIKGQTIHSWAGIGLGDDDAEDLFDNAKKNKFLMDKILQTQVLIIDEVSMLKAELLDKLDKYFQRIRFSKESFGGLQIIFCGDFLQLPPVWMGGETKDFAFNSKSWKNSDIKVVCLKEIVRQHSDKKFASLLNRIRVGDVSNLSLLKSRIDHKFPDDGIDPVYLFCKNYDVDKLNKELLSEIKADKKIFKSKDSGSAYHVSFFNKHCPAIEELTLKVGAQVMLLCNLDTKSGLVNGSIGRVVGWMTNGIIVKFKDTEHIVTEFTWELKEQRKVDGYMKNVVVATRTQIPLKVAYALTVHKSQGSTLDRAVIDISEAFAEGQIYVALSRVRDLDSLSVSHFTVDKIKVNKECLDFYKDNV